MRAFGKFLVYTNLVLSLIFLGWALGLFMQRLDWAPHKSIIKGEINKESGIMYRLEQEVKQLGEASELAERRYLKDADALPQAEEERLAYKKYYKDRLLLGEKGIDSEGKKAKPPVVELQRKPNSQMLVIDDKQQKALKSRDQDVDYLDSYLEQYRKLAKDIDDTQLEIERLVEENKKLTEAIAGIPGKTRGLRGDLEANVNYKRLFEDEMAILKPLLVNQRINVEQQKRRLAQLQDRYKELAARLGLNAN
jgi:hypothetical protein